MVKEGRSPEDLAPLFGIDPLEIEMLKKSIEDGYRPVSKRFQWYFEKEDDGCHSSWVKDELEASRPLVTSLLMLGISPERIAMRLNSFLLPMVKVSIKLIF